MRRLLYVVHTYIFQPFPVTKELCGMENTRRKSSMWCDTVVWLCLLTFSLLRHLLRIRCVLSCFCSSPVAFTRRMHVVRCSMAFSRNRMINLYRRCTFFRSRRESSLGSIQYRAWEGCGANEKKRRNWLKPGIVLKAVLIRSEKKMTTKCHARTLYILRLVCLIWNLRMSGTSMHCVIVIVSKCTCEPARAASGCA